MRQFVLMIILLLFTAACSSNQPTPASDNGNYASDANDANISHNNTPSSMNNTSAKFAEHYNAVSLDQVLEECPYSADILDNYSTQNIIADYIEVIDVIYSENERYLILEPFTNYDENYLMLKIDDSQYAQIKDAQKADPLLYIDAIFKIESISRSLSVNNSYSDMFSLKDDTDISSEANDTGIADGTDTLYFTRVLKGILVDMQLN